MDKNAVLRNVPGLDRVLEWEEIKSFLAAYPTELIKNLIRAELELIRHDLMRGDKFDVKARIISLIQARIPGITEASLKKVINATGIIVHTNLGRAPFGKEILREIEPVLTGYNNLEFNLETGNRGSRYDHLVHLMCTLTGAEDVLVVNNNAAALLLILRCFARKKEVMVSRGELIEIGGSFRVPSIMQASDCKMIEVGTTNKTRLSDYREHLTAKTAILLKTHPSNFVMQGFTESVEFDEIARFARESGIISVFDLGNGLINKNIHPLFKNETDVKDALDAGIDLVCFSGDKLLGGPQAGIILGSKALISKLKKEQITRALRVDKVTLALLEAIIKRYLIKLDQIPDIQTYNFISRSEEELARLAGRLQDELRKHHVESQLINQDGRFGGGTMPAAVIPSKAVQINFKASGFAQKELPEFVYLSAMQASPAVAGLLIKGQLSFNLLAIFEDDIPQVAQAVAQSIEVFTKQKTAR